MTDDSGWATPDPADDLAIRRTLTRYATGIDQKDWTLFRQCFEDDCHTQYGALEWRGGDHFTAEFERIHAPLTASMHRILNADVVEIDGDSARTRSYCDVILIRNGAVDGDTMRATGIYEDTLRRRGGRWRIATRVFRAVQYEGNIGIMALDAETVASSYRDAHV